MRKIKSGFMRITEPFSVVQNTLEFLARKGILVYNFLVSGSYKTLRLFYY